MEPKFYAGIGSRKTPIGILALMTLIGKQMALEGYVLRSGAAQGADTAFEHGCDLANGKKEIYIPWQGFQGRMQTEEGVWCLQSPDAYDLAAQYHPAWHRCSYAAMNLHARNCYQVLGARLDSPVDKVICWTEGGTGKGGTGQALRIARDRGIQVLDLGDHETYLAVHAAVERALGVSLSISTNEGG